MAEQSSRLARIAAGLAAVAVTLTILGILGVQIGLLRPEPGFRIFGLGAVVGGLLSLILGVIAFFTTRADSDGRRNAWMATATGVLLVALVAVGASPGSGLPAINDITTNLDDPPAFGELAAHPDNEGRDMGYPADFVPQVREAYPDLAPIAVAAPPEEAFQQAVAAAKALGWQIVWADPSGEAFEATDTSVMFRFVDDVRVRVSPGANGAVIDVRSKSRVGRGDLGANASRIRAFADQLGAPAVASE